MQKYYFKDGAFHLKNKWRPRIKWAIVLTTAVYLLNPGHMGSASVGLNQHFNEASSKFAVKESAIYAYIRDKNNKISKTEAQTITNMISKWSSEYSIDPDLVTAMCAVESRFDKHSISNAGAQGLCQVIPKWHTDKLKDAKKDVGSPEVFSIETNVYLAARILKDCMGKFKLVSDALLCYNGSNANPNGYDKKVLSELRQVKEYTRRVL
jgi:soluble lytic murein transglycosylase-like protein